MTEHQQHTLLLPPRLAVSSDVWGKLRGTVLRLWRLAGRERGICSAVVQETENCMALHTIIALTLACVCEERGCFTADPSDPSVRQGAVTLHNLADGDPESMSRGAEERLCSLPKSLHCRHTLPTTARASQSRQVPLQNAGRQPFGGESQALRPEKTANSGYSLWMLVGRTDTSYRKAINCRRCVVVASSASDQTFLVVAVDWLSLSVRDQHEASDNAVAV